MQLGVIILAGGEGHRIGGHKPLRRLGEKRLIDHAVRQALSWSSEVAIAVRRASDVPQIDLLLLYDGEFARPVAGIDPLCASLSAGDSTRC